MELTEVKETQLDPVIVQATDIKAPKRSPKKTCLDFLLNFKFLAIFGIPAALLYILCLKTTNANLKEFEKGLYLLLVFAGYLVTGCLPYAAIGMVPLVMSPLLKIAKGRAFPEHYMGDADMMAFTGIFIALAIINSGLTNRMACRILSISGGNLRLCFFLSLIISAFCGMWYPDTAIMVVMWDVMEKVKEELKAAIPQGSLGNDRIMTPSAEEEAPASQLVENNQAKETNSKAEALTSASNSAASGEMSVEEENEQILETYKISVLHAIAITTSLANMFWLFPSTATNVLMTRRSPATDMGSWLSFSGPIIFMILPTTIAYLDCVFFGCGRNRPAQPSVAQGGGKDSSKDTQKKSYREVSTTNEIHETLQSVYEEKYGNFGKLTTHECGVLFLLISSAFLFIFSDSLFYGSWSYFSKKHVKVSTIAVLAAVLLFFIPKVGFGIFKRAEDPEEKPRIATLLGWKTIQTKFPWGLIIFIGGCIGLAAASEDSKLNAYIAFQLQKIDNLWLTLLLLVSMSLTLASLVSNTTAARMMVKISNTVEKSFKHLPTSTYFVFPCVAVTALAFCVPGGTPSMAYLHTKGKGPNLFRCICVGLPLTVLYCAIVCVYVVFW